jgi:hypothetical protein
MLKYVRKRFDLKVDQKLTSVSALFELDKDIKQILGVMLTSDREDLLYYRGTQKIEIDKVEYFPENFESKLLMCGINVTPSKRYYDLENVSAGSGRINVLFKDNENTLASSFTPYRVSFYFLCALESHDIKC